jgi:hypothetical protein
MRAYDREPSRFPAVRVMSALGAVLLLSSSCGDEEARIATVDDDPIGAVSVIPIVVDRPPRDGSIRG